MPANALVGSHLDYCNSLFRNLSALNLCRLQCVQKNFARIVANTTKYSHITPIRKCLHWLPIVHRSVFKTPLLVYKFLHSGYPKYFEPFLKPRHSVYRTVEVSLIVYCSRSHILHQCISLKSIFASALHMMLQGFGMICLMMFTQPNRSLHSGRS